ncbi:hypothetical protein ACHWQZ_G019100 [Mnemiopsis leidyi]
MTTWDEFRRIDRGGTIISKQLRFDLSLGLKQMVKSGELWVWGQGGSGQLGTKSNKVEDLPTPSKSQISFVGIAAGRNYSLAISDDLRVYRSGVICNQQNDGIKEFSRIEALTNIKAIAVGQSHAAAVNGNGEVYLWGNNKDTQVCPKKIALVTKPMKVTGLNTVSIVQVSCGEGFTLCRTVDGRLYSWGRGKWGVLGQGDERNRNIPSLVTSLPFTDIVHIDAGHSYAAAVSQEGELLTFGRNTDGQLGHGHKENVLVPTPVEAMGAHHVIKVSCSRGEKGCFTAILVDTRVVYMVGNGTLGRLGTGESKNLLKPTKIPLSFFNKEKVSEVVAGTTMCHALTVAGNVFVWGSGNVGQTGLLEARRIRNFATERPKKIEALPKGRQVTVLSSSCDHVLALVENE